MNDRVGSSILPKEKIPCSSTGRADTKTYL